MYRTAIFAHFDKNNSIQKFVVYYLQELKKHFAQIIFVSDSDIKQEELKKINNIVDAALIGRHGEYDFGSYKKGFLYLSEHGMLDNIDELVFINDSCYGPVLDLSNVFEKMESVNVDFWGLTTGKTPALHEKKQHIQSYFVAFKPCVFMSDCFKQFINSIKGEDSKREIVIKYEMGLTANLENNGFCWDVFSEISKILYDAYLYHYKELILYEKFPLLKRSIPLRKEANYTSTNEIKTFIQKETLYNYEYIQEDIDLNKNKESIKTKIWFIISYSQRKLTAYYWDYIYIYKLKKMYPNFDFTNINKIRKHFNLLKLSAAWLYWFLVRPIIKHGIALLYKKRY